MLIQGAFHHQYQDAKLKLADIVKALNETQVAINEARALRDVALAAKEEVVVWANSLEVALKEE